MSDTFGFTADDHAEVAARARDRLRDELGSPWTEAELKRLQAREHFAWRLAKPLIMTGLAVLVSVTEPFILWFILIEAMIWLAAAVDWLQFAHEIRRARRDR